MRLLFIISIAFVSTSESFIAERFRPFSYAFGGSSRNFPYVSTHRVKRDSDKRIAFDDDVTHYNPSGMPRDGRAALPTQAAGIIEMVIVVDESFVEDATCSGGSLERAKAKVRLIVERANLVSSSLANLIRL